MRKILFISAAAFMAAACSQTEPEAQEMQVSGPVTAHIATQTRTSLEPAEAGTYKVNWNEGDEIILSNGKTEGIYKTYDNGSSQAVFMPVNRIAIDFSKGVIAAYPTEEMYLGNPDLEEEIYLSIPTEQIYVAGSFADEAMPMVSEVAYEPVLNFKNAAGVLKLNISCSTETIKVTSVTVTSAEAISGECCYIPAEGTYYPDTSLLSEDFVNLDCGDGVDVGSEAVPFHIVVPNQTYTGMKITIAAADGREHTFKMKADKAITVERAAVVTIPLKIDTFGEVKNPEVTLTAGEIAFNKFDINVSMKNVNAYFCGLQTRDSFSSDLESGFLFEGLQWKTAYTGPMTYSGTVSKFQEECADMLIEPGHEYVFWIIPQSANGEYTEEDVRYVEVQTKSYTSGGSVKISASDIEIGMTEVSMKLSANQGVLYIYHMLLTSDQLAQYPTQQDKINLLLGGSAYFIDRMSDTMVRKFLSPGTEYTLIAIGVNSKGQYGQVFTMSFTTEDIPYNGMTVHIDMDSQKLAEDQTIRWSVTGGNAVEYRYIFSDMNKYLWTGTLNSSIDKADEVMALNSGLYYINKTKEASAKVNLESGHTYIIVVTAVDSEGYTAESSWWEFTY